MLPPADTLADVTETPGRSVGVPASADSSARSANLPSVGTPTELRRALIGATVAAGLLPTLRLAEMTRSIDYAFITALVFVGAAWHLWREVPPGRVRGANSIFAWIALVTISWQLVRLPAADFWFVRIALPGSVLALALLWGDVLRAWRILAAMTVWVVWLQFAKHGEHALSGEWICQPTAALSGWLLWQCGQDVVVEGSIIRLVDGAVQVGGPCTGIPLGSILLALASIAALLLRASLGSTVRLMATAVAIAFGLGVVRVGLLATVVDDEAWFSYWHSPTGGAWFAALAMLGLAAAMPRSFWASVDSPKRPGEVSTGRLRAQTLRRVVWLTAGVAGVAFATSERDGANFPLMASPPAWPGAVLETHATKRFDISDRPHNRFAWEQQATYRLASGGKVHVTLGYLPLLLGPSPTTMTSGPRWLHEVRDWSRVPAGNSFAWAPRREPSAARAAFFSRAGVQIASETEWRESYLARITSLNCWLDWFIRHEALCDKSAYFLAFRWEDAQADSTEAEALTEAVLATWQAHARTAAPPRHFAAP